MMGFEQAVYFSMGVFMVVFLIFYASFKLDKDHVFIKFFGLFSGIFLLLLIPHSYIKYENNCDIVINKTIESGTNMTYSYDTYCYDNNSNTNTIFLKGFLTFISVFLTYFVIYVIYKLFTKFRNDSMSYFGRK